MPNRSIKDEMQGTLHRFAQSLGLSPPDEGDVDKPPATSKPPGTPTAPPPKVDPPKGVDNAAGALKNRETAVDKAVADAGG